MFSRRNHPMGLHVILDRTVHTTGISPDFGLSMGIGVVVPPAGKESGPSIWSPWDSRPAFLPCWGRRQRRDNSISAAPGRIPPTRCATTAWSPSRSRCIPRRNSIQPWLPRSRQPAMTVPLTWHLRWGRNRRHLRLGQPSAGPGNKHKLLPRQIKLLWRVISVPSPGGMIKN